MMGNLCFSLFVIGGLTFTVISATYEPEDPLFRPSTKITAFLTSTSDATLQSAFMPANQSAFESFINVTDVESSSNLVSNECEGGGAAAQPLDCRDPEVFHLMMNAAIEQFKDIHFSRFGKPVAGSNDSTCDMAWRYRPKEGKAAAFYKDYRRFVVSRSSEDCSLSIVGIGEYHTGVNARKKKKKKNQNQSPESLPVAGETVNDTLPVVDERWFRRAKYLVYVGGGDRCKSMNHYLWSFLCALGEAQYLNRTLVMDLSICLSKIYTSSDQDEEGKDFRFYFDFEHLRESASVLDQDQFWADWEKWHDKDKLSLYLAEDFRIAPMKLVDIKDNLIMRKFGLVEPDNYWYRVCEGETESVVQRPWHLLWKSRRLMDIVSAIASKLNWDYDSAHIVRGQKAKNKDQWPNLDSDTSPDALVSTLQNKIEDQRNRNLYIATNEPDTSFFDPLKEKYATRFLDEYKELWDDNSEWYSETTKLNKGVPVEFDGYMRVSVDTEVFLRGKKQIQTFNDLTNDCKDGVNTCSASSS